MRHSIIPLLAFTLLLLNCKESDKDDLPNANNPGSPSLESTFQNGDFMPSESGKDNGNVSPQLTIKNVPQNTVEMVLTMRDIDHNDSWHWAIWNIPPTKTDISKGETWSGVPVTKGNNDYGTNYVGPFPPSVHRYKITVYFLKEKISLGPAFYKGLPTAMEGKIISDVSITGKYQ